MLEYLDAGELLLSAQKAFNLEEPEIEIPLVVFPQSISTIMRRIALLGDLSAILRHPTLHAETPRQFGESEIALVRAAYRDLQALPLTYAGIHRAVSLLDDLRSLRKGSLFRVLGLFAILELLLTHNPGDKEIGDSLTHQVSTKVPLIDKRLPERLPYGEFFDKTDDKTVWKRLYAYRSALAHGVVPDFSKRNLSILRSADNALRFLHLATRRITRHTLLEPDLFQDLKDV